MSPPAPDVQGRQRHGAARRAGLRLRVLTITLLPMLLASGLLVAYFIRQDMATAEAALWHRGRDAVDYLASACAQDANSGDLVHLKRLLERQGVLRHLDGIGVTDRQGEWRLVSGQPLLLRKPTAGNERQEWRDGRLLFLTRPIFPPGTPLADGRPGNPAAAIGQVTVILNTAGLEAEFQRLLEAGLRMLAAVMAAAGLLAWWLSRRLSEPLSVILGTVRELADGHLERRLPETGKGEIGDLEAGINRLAEALSAYSREMESRVTAATAEITEQKRAAESATQAKSKFLATASHDMRQPLHAMNLLVASLRENLGEARPDALAIVDKIEASAHAMDNLLTSLLDLSRLEAGIVVAKPECFPISRIFRRLEQQFGTVARGKGLELRVHCSRRTIFTDPLLLERILSNLVTNAIRYTDQGKVLLGLRASDAGWVRVAVWDTGQGIPDGFRERIFEEYFQLDNPERDRDKGLGLGLSIVKRLARLLGSPVDVQSRPGRGSCFSLRLPLCHRDAPEAAQESIHASPTPKGLVALIDDDETILEAMMVLFEQWGIELAVGDSAAQVRDDLLALGRGPDAILSDFRLRDGRTGVEAVAELRAAFGADLPAALITGDTAPDTIQALNASGLPVLHKPLKPPRLRAFISHLLSSRAQAGPP